MMNTVVAGRIYNGKVHDWIQNKDKDNEQDRTLFRGRLNYRNPESGDYHYIDAVCFKDFGDKGGLVAWLDNHYSAENSDSEKGGDAIIVTGYVRPTTKRRTVEIKYKKNGKPATKEIPDVPFESFEFVILSATFPPTSQGEGSRKNDIESDEDFEDFEEIEVVNDDDKDDSEDGAEDEKEEKKTSSKKDEKKAPAKQKDKQKEKKEKASSKKDEDDDFFEE